MKYSKIKIFNFDSSDIINSPEKIEKEVNDFCSKHMVRDIKFKDGKTIKREYLDEGKTFYSETERDVISIIIFYNETY